MFFFLFGLCFVSTIRFTISAGKRHVLGVVPSGYLRNAGHAARVRSIRSSPQSAANSGTTERVATYSRRCTRISRLGLRLSGFSAATVIRYVSRVTSPEIVRMLKCKTCLRFRS